MVQYLNKISHYTIGLDSSRMLYKEEIVKKWQKFVNFDIFAIYLQLLQYLFGALNEIFIYNLKLSNPNLRKC